MFFVEFRELATKSGDILGNCSRLDRLPGLEFGNRLRNFLRRDDEALYDGTDEASGVFLSEVALRTGLGPLGAPKVHVSFLRLARNRAAAFAATKHLAVPRLQF